MNFGEKLTGIREKNNFTQSQLAEKLNVSMQTVSRWENDNGSPNINQLKTLCDIFSVSSEYFLSDDDGLLKEEVKSSKKEMVEIIEEKLNFEREFREKLNLKQKKPSGVLTVIILCMYVVACIFSFYLCYRSFGVPNFFYFLIGCTSVAILLLLGVFVAFRNIK